MRTRNPCVMSLGAAQALTHDRARPGWICCLLSASLLICACSSEPEVGEEVEHYLEAQQALESGDTETALKELDATIQIRPDSWAYYERAKIYSDLGKDTEALADCEAGLKLAPNHTELKWLQAELKKDPSRRFKGRNTSPPRTEK